MADKFVSGLGHWAAYVGVTVLACLGYGAVFLLIGLLARTPIIPAALILGWETINFLLPPVLKKISVTYDLESLSPVPLPPDPLCCWRIRLSPWWQSPDCYFLSPASSCTTAGAATSLTEFEE